MKSKRSLSGLFVVIFIFVTLFSSFSVPTVSFAGNSDTMVNGSFEDNAFVPQNGAGWHVYSTSSGTPALIDASTEAITPMAGTNVAKFAPIGGTAILMQHINVVSGQEYTLTYYTKGKNAEGYWKVLLGCINGFGNDDDATHTPAHHGFSLPQNTTTDAADSNGWSKVTTIFTAASDAVNISFRYDNWGGTALEPGYLDAISLVGQAPATPSPTPVPTATPVPLPGYTVVNGDFENNLFVSFPTPGWNSFSGSNGSPSIIDASADTIVSIDGSKVVKFTPLGGAAILRQQIQTDIGQQYKFIYYTLGTSPAGYAKISKGCVNGWGNDDNATHSPADGYNSVPNIETSTDAPDANGWTKVTSIFTANDTTTNINFRYDNWGGTAIPAGYLDGISVNPYTPPTPTPTPVPTPTPIFGAELITNGQFSTDLTAWADGGGAGSISSANPINGNYDLITTYGWGNGSNQHVFGITPGAFKLSYDFNGNSMIWLGQNDWDASPELVNNSFASSTTWTHREIDFVITSVASSGYYTLRLIANGADCSFDNVSLRSMTDPNATPTPVPTATPTPSPTPEPTPTPVPTQTPGPNFQVTNGNFETNSFVSFGTSGWNVFSGSGNSPEIISASNDGIVAYEGSNVMKFAPLNGAAILRQWINVISGKDYEVVYYLKGTLPNYQIVIKDCLNGWAEESAGHIPAHNISASVPVTTTVGDPDANGWVKVTNSFTAVEDAIILSIRYDNWSSTPIETKYMDNMTIHQVSAQTYNVNLTALSAADLMNTGDTSYDNYMNAAGKTTVTIRNSYLATDIIASTQIDPTSKTATFSGLTDREYLVTVSRNGYLIRDFGITVAGENVNLGDRSLLAGDVFTDGIIDGSDSESLFSTIGFSYGDTTYVPAYDVNLDGIVDGTDSEMLFANLGSDVGIYLEPVDYYN